MSRIYFRPILLLALLIGVSFSVSGYFLVKENIDKERKREFKSIFTLYAESLERELQFNMQILRDLARFYQSSDQVSRSQFSQFTRSTALQYPSIQALEWIPRVVHHQRKDYEILAREEGVNGFQITERHPDKGMIRAGNRDEYFPVYFVEPLESNEAAVGFDLASNKTRLNTLQASREHKSLLATAAITLVQETKQQKGFLVFIPIFEMNTTTREQHQETVLNGFVLGVYRIADISTSALQRSGFAAYAVSVTLSDLTDSDAKTALFAYNDDEAAAQSIGYKNTRGIHIGGRDWLLEVSPTKSFMAQKSYTPAYAVLGGGLIITLLVFSSLSILSSREQEVKRQVKLKATQLQDSESQSNTIIQTSLDAIVTVDDRGDIELFNPAAEKMFAYVEGEISGRGFDLLMTSRAARDQGDYFHDYWMAKSDRRQSFEDEGRTSKALIFPIEIQIAEFVIKAEKKYLCVIRDITQRKEAERVKNEFLSTVSHELRTPLTSIRASLGMMTTGALGEIPEKAARMAKIAEQNTKRLIALVNDLLDIEKLQSGRIAFQFKSLDLVQVVDETLEINQPLASKYSLRFELKESGSPLRVAGDSGRLAQVVSNLLSNAAKFSPKGGVVSVSIERQGNPAGKEGKSRVRVSVTDQGPGVPESFRDKVFERFKQADSSDTRQKGGTGLGLSISKQIIEQHGGIMGFDSEVGKGATFYFELPCAVSAEGLGIAQKGQPIRHAVVGDVKSSAVQSGGRVLVLEDDPDIALLLATMLEQEGFQTAIARNAHEAREHLARSHYDAMTVDIMLPDQDGISLIREVRLQQDTQHLATIVVSAKAHQAREEVEAASMGIVDWIDKPIDKERLLSAIRLAAASSADQKSKILYVEDDTDLIEVVSSILGDELEIVAVTTMQQAMAKLEHETFALVLLDVILPDGSGLDLIPLLSNHGKSSTPVVIFSAQVINEDVNQKVAASLIKSRTSNDELVQTIKSLIGPA